MFSNRSREFVSDHKHKFTSSAKDKKLSKLIATDSDTEGDSEHELSYYVDDRVKLMKEVLKIIKSRKIKSMAPDCMKNMELQEINSMLLEELLGISNKRLKYIFEGKVLEEESSTDEDQTIDVISLDDISDDDFVVISDEEVDEQKEKHKRRKIKEEPRGKSKKVKKEKTDKTKSREIEKIKEKLDNSETLNPNEKETIGEENLMSVLELLELQARARAIRSQLELENKRKQEEQQQSREKKKELQEQDDDDAIIMEVPKDVEIIITSSDSENEQAKAGSSSHHHDRHSSRWPPKSVNEYSNNSSVEINEESQDSSTNNLELSGNKNHTREKNTSDNDKEDGEVSESEIQQKRDIGADDVTIAHAEKARVFSNKLDSDSSSNDNLLVVMQREQRKRRRGKISVPNKHKGSLTSEGGFQENVEVNDGHELSDILGSVPEKTDVDDKVNCEIDDGNQKMSLTSLNEEGVQELTTDSSTNNPEKEDNTSQLKSSKIDEAINEFMKSQPPPLPPPDNTEELKRLEEETKEKEEKTKKNKQKRLKSLKNKLQSFKQDTAVESSNVVTVLENIVIKSKTVQHSRKRLEESHDLVINVDQDDLDCIMCE